MLNEEMFFKKIIITEKKENSLFFFHNPLGVKRLTCLRLQFSHLNKHKFKHGFWGTITPMCAFNPKIGSTEHFLLWCHINSSRRLKLFDNLNKINHSFIKLSTKDQVNILYGYSSNNSICLSQDIIKLPINFRTKAGRFNRPLIRFNKWMCFYISHPFVLSNIVKCNLSKFPVSYIAGYKSTPYYSFKLLDSFFFLLKTKSYFPIFLFAANYKVNKNYI